MQADDVVNAIEKLVDRTDYERIADARARGVLTEFDVEQYRKNLVRAKNILQRVRAMRPGVAENRAERKTE